MPGIPAISQSQNFSRTPCVGDPAPQKDICQAWPVADSGERQIQSGSMTVTLTWNPEEIRIAIDRPREIGYWITGLTLMRGSANDSNDSSRIFLKTTSLSELGPNNPYGKLVVNNDTHSFSFPKSAEEAGEFRKLLAVLLGFVKQVKTSGRPPQGMEPGQRIRSDNDLRDIGNFLMELKERMTPSTPSTSPWKGAPAEAKNIRWPGKLSGGGRIRTGA